MKLLSLPAALYTMLAVLVIPAALAVAMGLNMRGSDALTSMGAETQGFEVAGFGQPLVILLAALIVGSEYQNGLLRSSQLATPNRARLLGAKAIVITVLSVSLAFLSIGLAVALRQIVLGDSGIPLFSFTGAMWINLATVALNWTLISLVSGALTVLARSVLLPVIVLVPMVLGLGVSLVGVLPWLKFAPDLAGLQLLTEYPGIGLLDPVVGGLVMAAWAVALSAAAFVTFNRRDA
ncbi:ABC transporter permease [Cryobacterium sp. SO2]|uniref:ABC transporter permease n=1 Tax=Cryobacterium sp. SO2 TaxID=1897060 RepID=UPI00223DEF1A|nr:ABC transporter permease [Cryobacterium sp. SO2]WEO78737.1 ABC transporter permease [Cryobacterium sp. SO2]